MLLGDGLRVSRLGYGAMALTHAYGETADREAAIATLHRCLDLGLTFVDTADVYGQPRPGTEGPAGTNEELVAEVLHDRRDEVQLATKFGIAGATSFGGAVRGDRDYVRSACEASLRRLGVDVIDLYYLHRPDPEVPVAETVAAMAELVAEGKVRHLGLSEVTGAELRSAAEVHPIAAVQSEWSLWSRDVEAHVVPAAIETGTGFVPYSPLGRGFLTGALDRDRIASGMLAAHPRYTEHFDANQAVVDVVRGVAQELEATPAQVALAWLFAQGRRLGLPVVPIPGSSKPARVEENAGAVTLQLSDEQLHRLDTAVQLVQGDRNPVTDNPAWISSGRE